MARMYPQELPDDVRSGAERLLYEQFKQQLPDSFVVLHSVKWLMRDRKHHDRDGEVDFLIVHPELGVLILEVKGGRLRVDANTGRWYTMDRYNREDELKSSPFDQAQRNLYNLKAKLEEAPKTRPYSYRFQRGIALPDVNVGSTNIGLYGDRELIIDSTDLPQLEQAIRRIMGVPERRYHIGAEAVKALVDTLQPTLVINRIGINTQLLKAEERIATLTTDQFSILDSLGRRPKAAISGCAGSGKTMLAMEKARRLANEGFQVLFTCFNKNLALWIRELFAQDQFTVNDRITATHFHGLAHEFCRRAGVTLPPIPSAEDRHGLSSYLSDVLPEKLNEAVGTLPIRFDAIIVDEGQDFAEMWWIPLLDLLKDKEHGVFYIFYDDNQRIYSHNMALPINDPPFLLNVNCRNTDRIHGQVLPYYLGTPPPVSRGPQGLQPEFISLQAGGEKEALRKLLSRLVTEERLPTNNVVILTPRGTKTSELKEGERLGPVTLTWERRPGPGVVQVSSIYSFKGLESPIVILAELSKLEAAQQDYLLYVATSRPRSHLVVLGDLPEPQAQMQALQPEDHWTGE
jgi:hypothetical protein